MVTRRIITICVYAFSRATMRLRVGLSAVAKLFDALSSRCVTIYLSEVILTLMIGSKERRACQRGKTMTTKQSRMADRELRDSLRILPHALIQNDKLGLLEVFRGMNEESDLQIETIRARVANDPMLEGLSPTTIMPTALCLANSCSTTRLVCWDFPLTAVEYLSAPAIRDYAKRIGALAASVLCHAPLSFDRSVKRESFVSAIAGIDGEHIMTVPLSRTPDSLDLAEWENIPVIETEAVALVAAVRSLLEW